MWTSPARPQDFYKTFTAHLLVSSFLGPTFFLELFLLAYLLTQARLEGHLVIETVTTPRAIMIAQRVLASWTTQIDMNLTPNLFLCRWTMEGTNCYFYLIILKSLPKEEHKPYLLIIICMNRQVSLRHMRHLMLASTYKTPLSIYPSPK